MKNLHHLFIKITDEVRNMEEIIFITLISVLALSFISFNVLATSTHIEEAMRHTEAAMTSTDGHSIASHATDAITHARAAYDDKENKINPIEVDEALRFLNSAINEGNNAKVEAAQEAARKAHELFKFAK